MAQDLENIFPTFTGFGNGWRSQFLGETDRFKRVLTFEMTQMESLTEDVEPVPDGMEFVIDEWLGHKCRVCGASFQTPRGVKMLAMTAHGKRWPEEKYVTNFAEHSYQCQFCWNKYYSVENQFERFREVLELINRFEFEFCRRGNNIF